MINESSRGSFAANASAVLAVLGALGAMYLPILLR
jgi:hypothetical protein